MWAEIMSLILMARVVWHRFLFIVTWLTRMELAWQSSVTTVRTGHTRLKEYRVTFTTRERVCLSWLVSPESPHTVNSLSSMSAIIRLCGYTRHTPGGCLVILKRWSTGVEHHLAVVKAHVGWPTHAQTPALAVIVIRMTMHGEKTAVCWLTRRRCL